MNPLYFRRVITIDTLDVMQKRFTYVENFPGEHNT